MKREYVEDKQDPPTSMFSPNKQLPTPPHPHSHFHNPTEQHHQPSDSPSCRRLNEDSPYPPAPHDGATIEVVRRPRGRPPGSKNKPKPPIIITRPDTSEPPMSPYVLELPPGVDIIDSTTRFCRRRGIGLCVLNGNGVVANVCLKQPTSTGPTTLPPATVTFHGRFDVLSLTATIMPPTMTDPNINWSSPFAISLAGPQGQVVGGLVVGPLVSAGTIYLIAATFNNPSFHRLPLEMSSSHHDHDRDRQDQQNDSSSHEGGVSGDGGPIYSYQPSDVIWAPTARQPPPY